MNLIKDLTDQEILKFQRRARYVAVRSGYPKLADDFAQEVILTFIERPNRHATVDQLFIDYLRGMYGDTRSELGSARSKAEHTACSIDYARDIAIDPVSERQDGGCAFLFRGRQYDLYQLYFVNELSEAAIGELFGVTESRVSQMLKPMKEAIQEYYILREYQYLSEISEESRLWINWIKI